MIDKLILLDQLLQSPWKEALSESKKHSCRSYHSALIKKIKQVGEEAINAPALTLLSQIVSMRMSNSRKDGDPYKPMWLSQEERTFLPQDLTDEQSDELFVFLEHIDSHELKARIADTIWVSKKGNTDNRYLAAKIAANEYTLSGKLLLEDEHPIRGIKRFERAVGIAAGLGKAGINELKTTLTTCEESLPALIDRELNASQYRLVSLLFERRFGNLHELGGLCYDLSEQMELQNKNWDLTRSYWELTADIFKSCKQNKAAIAAKRRQAWTYIKQVVEADSFILKSVFLADAIEAFRRNGESRKKIDVLHRWLLRVEKQTTKEMHTITSKPIDLSDSVAHSREQIRGKSLREALIAICLITTLRDPDEMRRQVIKDSEKFIFSSLFGSQYRNEEGKVVAKSGAIGLDPNGLDEESILHKMHQDFHLNVQVQTIGAIEPARRQLLREHLLIPEELFPLVSNNPFVPAGREWTFARGLAAGFEGDFLIADHLLIPQIENSLRYIVVQRGGIPSSINNGIQKERMLGDLLDDPHVVNTLGKRMVFGLKTLLVEQTGSNRRHDLCHGLINDNQFNSVTSVYIWWLVLRMCCLPLISEHIKRKQLMKQLVDLLEQLKKQIASA